MAALPKRIFKEEVGFAPALIFVPLWDDESTIYEVSREATRRRSTKSCIVAMWANITHAFKLIVTGKTANVSLKW